MKSILKSRDRAIDQEGDNLDIQPHKTKDDQSSQQTSPLLNFAGQKLKNNGFYVRTKHCTILSISIIALNQIIDISSDIVSNPKDFKTFVILHVH